MISFEIGSLLESATTVLGSAFSNKASFPLKSCVDICRASECTAQQLKAMHPTEDVYAMGQKSRKEIQDRKRNSSCHMSHNPE